MHNNDSQRNNEEESFKRQTENSVYETNRRKYIKNYKDIKLTGPN